jgi:hypothetical protein
MKKSHEYNKLSINVTCNSCSRPLKERHSHTHNLCYYCYLLKSGKTMFKGNHLDIIVKKQHLQYSNR